MAHPVRVLCALSLGSALLLATAAPALACSCAFPPIEAAREGAAAVFEGRVLAVSSAKAGDAGAGGGVREVTLAVVRSWKALDQQEQVVVRTASAGSLCGLAFTKGKSYLVYADEEAGGLAVSACSRTRLIADAHDDLVALGAGATPVRIAARDAGASARAGAGSATTAARAADAGSATTAARAADAGSASTSAATADGGSPKSVDAGVGADAGAAGPPTPQPKSGGCASGRGQASLAPYFLGLPALLGWRRRRARARSLTRS